MEMSEKQKHTPGPWRRSSLQPWYVIPGDKAEPICSLAEFTDGGETEHVFPDDNAGVAEANLCLIAAAPDLLKIALKFKWFISSESHELTWKDEEELDAAIQRATGEAL
jgi:hypothetical protein